VLHRKFFIESGCKYRSVALIVSSAHQFVTRLSGERTLIPIASPWVAGNVRRPGQDSTHVAVLSGAHQGAGMRGWGCGGVIAIAFHEWADE
jgi:hypothetical protein